MTSLVANPPNVRSLRRLWKPHKERLHSLGGNQSTSIRFHRACSWLAQAEASIDDEDYDTQLIHLWIAFNSLYGQWDEGRKEPKSDRECWRLFTDKILEIDEGDHVSKILIDNKRLVMTLLDDEHLSGYFWQEPCEKRAGQSKKSKFNARSWYVEKRWVMVLDHILERIYLMRCQLVHGAATFGGNLNREPLKHCVWMMRHLVPAFLLAWIDNGANIDWGPMCYPPLKEQPTRNRVNGNPRQPR